MVKRKVEEIIVDPETGNVVESSKRPKIDLNTEIKVKCLKALKMGFFEFFEKLYPSSMMVDSEEPVPDHNIYNISVGNHIASILFTLHHIARQKARAPSVTGNMESKTSSTSFVVNSGGKTKSITTKEAKALWAQIVARAGLKYENFPDGSAENWYGTMGPYIDMFVSFALRYNELRLGHDRVPLGKVDGKPKSFQVSSYGLSGAHHILLEGASFPPERRSSIVQSLGPMTAWLCMLRTDGIYRKKFQAAVKRAMAHIPGIDDIIEITKSIKLPSEISSLTTLLAEILLVTTSRQASRIYFPLSMFAIAMGEEAMEHFNTTGKGAWFLYKTICDMKVRWMINGTMEAEMAQQMVFHSIFGTYREDLGILEQITNVGNWYTREQLGEAFIRPEGEYTPISFEPIKVKYYSKMACANQTGLLTGVYNQVATALSHSIEILCCSFLKN